MLLWAGCQRATYRQPAEKLTFDDSLFKPPKHYIGIYCLP